MKKLLFFTILSYLIGSVNPAAIFGSLKKKDLRQSGTGNLGATNALLVLGKAFGAAVMLLDIGKGYLCTRLGSSFSASVPWAGILTGAFAVIGHIFPFYLGFRGGKGLAAFAGVVLAFDPCIFIILLPICTGLMLITDRTVTMPYAGAVLFPVTCAVLGRGVLCTLCAALLGALIAARHLGDLTDTLQGNDTGIREYLFSRRRRQ